jgi:DNA-binding beta-propeller fold protein YncE
MRRASVLAVAVLLARGAAAAGPAECLVEWRAPGAAATGSGARVSCRDGDPACDADGSADGRCTFAPRLCFNVADPSGACAPGALERLRVRAPQAAALGPSLAALGPPGSETCIAAAPFAVRRARALRASAREAGSARVDRDRLALDCARGTRAGAGRAVVVTTDFETGRLATVGVARPHGARTLEVPIHADAVVRTVGDRLYVVNRFLGDNVQVLDPRRGFTTVLQCSTGPGSNPHDIVLVGAHKAYVTRYDRGELWIVDPAAPGCGAFLRGTIDLRPWADADGLPEMDQMALVGERLFVSLERLDRARRFAPAGRSRLAVIDVATDTVSAVVELSGANAFGDATGLVREPGTGKLLVAEAGDLYRTGDGGIERVDPVTLTAEGFLITEDDLGGSITDFVIAATGKGYAIVLDAQLRNVLVAFDPVTRRVTNRLLTRVQYLPDIALGPDGLLWLADGGLPSPGIRIFDPADDRQLTRAAIDVGLPPFAIAFVP